MVDPSQENKILLAKIISTKGLKGEVKIKSFTEDPLDIVNYSLFDNNNKFYVIESAYIHKSIVVAKLETINSIEEAQKLIGLDLWADKESLPQLQEDDFYHIDLISLDVIVDKEKVGTVKAVFNFGAGDLLEIETLDNNSFLINFSKDNIPEVNIKENYLVITDISYINAKEK